MSGISARALNDTLGTAEFQGLNRSLEKVADAISKNRGNATAPLVIDDSIMVLALDGQKVYTVIDERQTASATPLAIWLKARG